MCILENLCFGNTYSEGSVVGVSEVLVPRSCPTLRNPMDCQAPLSWNSPGKDTGVGRHALLQGIFPTQGLNPGLPALKADSLLSEPPGGEMTPTGGLGTLCAWAHLTASASACIHALSHTCTHLTASASVCMHALSHTRTHRPPIPQDSSSLRM